MARLDTGTHQTGRRGVVSSASSPSVLRYMEETLEDLGSGLESVTCLATIGKFLSLLSLSCFGRKVGITMVPT